VRNAVLETFYTLVVTALFIGFLAAAAVIYGGPA
jgi:hypothetical protein